MKKALILRYGAYGDIIHISHLPRLLKEQGFDFVAVETNYKGFQLLRDNPFIDKITYLPDSSDLLKRRGLIEKKWALLAEEYDSFINLNGSIEYDILMMETQNDYYRNDKVRSNRCNINFYDHMTALAGYPNIKGRTGELFFTEEEKTKVDEYYSKYKDNFTILINLSGTSFHKQFIQAKEVAKWVLDTYEDAVIIETAGPEWKHLTLKEIDDKRIRSIIGIQPFRQAAALAKRVNCVIGCESGIMCAANMWNTPTIQLMTAASVKNHCEHAKNDYSLQSPAYCSPCHKGPYQYVGCPVVDGHLLCTYFDVDKIKENITKIYEKRNNA